MLVIDRKEKEAVIINENIEIIILHIGRNRIKFGVNAPKEISIKIERKEDKNEKDN